MKNNGKTEVFTNLVWRFTERCGAQGVSFVVSIVLARLLAPEAYGTIALVTVFISIFNVLISNGFGTALIQKKDADELDFSSVFYFSIVFCLFLYFLLFISAPHISSFYNEEILTPVIRILGIVVILSGINSVQGAFVSRNMIFKRYFFATLSGSIGSAVVGIVMAYMGYGVWSLVAQQLFSVVINTFVLWFTVKWRPKLIFSFNRLKILFSYGWKILVSALLETGYNEIRQLIIGKLYSTNDLAFYNKGRSFPNMVVTNINTSIDSVLLPTMSAEQDNKERVKAMTRRSITISCYVLVPIMVGLGVCAEPLISLLLTDKWLECVPFLRIFCFTYAFYPIHTANLNAIKAVGRSDLFLKMEIIKKTIGMALLLSTMWFGVMAMAYSLLVSTLTSQIINAWPNKKLLNYSYLEQLKDISPSLIASVLMGVFVYLIQFLGLSNILTLFIQVVSGVVIYIALSKFFHIESFNYILYVVKKIIKKEK